MLTGAYMVIYVVSYTHLVMKRALIPRLEPRL